MTYVANCQSTLDLYGVNIDQIGTAAFAEEQAYLYEISGSDCFLRNTTAPTYIGNVQYLQGLWTFGLDYCADNCSYQGYCQYGTCYCDEGFYGSVCSEVLCPGSFCIYDNEFFSAADCIFCSGYGDCVNGTCNCTEGYQGADCSMLACRDDCNGNGDCVYLYPISQCDCYGKYGGDTCDVILCLNNCNPPYGTCNTTTGECDCVENYYGIDCSVLGFSFAYELGLGLWAFTLIFI